MCKGFEVGHFDGEEVVGDEEGGGPDFPGDDFMLCEVDDHEDDDPADLEDVFLLQLPPDDDIEVVLKVLEEAVEVGVVLDDFLDVGYLFDEVVVHEGDVFVLEDLFPIGFFV